MSNLSLARIMYGSGEESRRFAGIGFTANARSIPALPFVPSAATQVSPSAVPALFRRIWHQLFARF